MGKVESMLAKYHNINKDMIRLSQDLRTAIEAATNTDGCIKSSIISDSPHGTDMGEPTYRHTADLMENLEQISVELANYAWQVKCQMLDLLEAKSQIDIAYFMLEPEEQTIIRLRYMDMSPSQCTWEQIAETAHYSRTQTFTIHGQAMKKIRKIVNIGLNRTDNVV